MGIVSTKQQRRNALAAMVRRVLTVLALGVVIVGALYAYDYLTTCERLAVTEVEMRGVSRIDDSELRRVLADLEGQNILLAPLEQFEARLEMHPRVESAAMKRIVPGKIRCTITEREPVALIFTDRFLEIDRNAMVMEEDDFTALLDLPIITGVSPKAIQPGKVCTDGSVQDALEVLRVAREIGGEFASDISELHVSRRGVMVRSLKDDRILVLGQEDFKNRLRKYFLLQETLDYRTRKAKTVVDLRFEDQVVLRGGI